MLLYDFLMLLYNAAQICDLKSASAHCEFTVIVNDLQISVFLTTHFCTVSVLVTPAPKSLLLIIPWAVSVCSKWEAAAVSSIFSSLNLLLLRLNISIVSHPERPSSPGACAILAHGTSVIHRGWAPFSIPWRKNKKMAAGDHQGLSLWKLWFLKVKDLSPDQSYKINTRTFSWGTQSSISARYSTINHPPKSNFIPTL